jgi:hypothetical protein
MTFFSGLENADETLKNRVCELIQVNKVYKARVVSCPDPGRYVIEFPHVTEALIKKTLLPSGESDVHEVSCCVFPYIHPVLSFSSSDI